MEKDEGKIIIDVGDGDEIQFDVFAANHPNLRNLTIEKKEDSDNCEINLKGIEKLKSVTSITIKPGVTVKDPGSLYACKNLEELFVYNQRDLRKIDLSRFPELRTVLVLEGGKAFDSLASLPNLKHIRISRDEENNTDEFSLKGIEKLKGVTSINILPEVKIKDFDSLYACKNLEELYVYNQRDLKEIDLSRLPKLRAVILNGCGVERVKGLDTKEPGPNCLYNFSACPNLKQVDGLEEFMEKAVDNQDVLYPIVCLDDVFYQKLMTKTVGGVPINQELEQKLIDEPQTKMGSNSVLINTEFCDNVYTPSRMQRGTPLQMKTQRKYIDYILDKQCGVKPDDDDWTKAKKAFDWVTENFTYARGMLNMDVREEEPSEEEKEGEKKKEGNAFGPRGYDHYYIASAYHSLLDRHDVEEDKNSDLGFKRVGEKGKYAVCEGIANVYIQMMERMGIESHFVTIVHDRGGAHGIVASKINGEYYYFDPTSELGNSRYFHFGMTQKQAKDAYEAARGPGAHFINDEERFLGAKDVQDGLFRTGFLEKGQVVEKKNKDKKRKPTAFDYFCSMKYVQKLLNTRLAVSVRAKLNKLNRGFEKLVGQENYENAKNIVNYFLGVPVHITKSIFGVMGDFYDKTKNSIKSFASKYFDKQNSREQEGAPETEGTNSPPGAAKKTKESGLSL